jgi:hypothetical protein
LPWDKREGRQEAHRSRDKQDSQRERRQRIGTGKDPREPEQPASQGVSKPARQDVIGN